MSGLRDGDNTLFYPDSEWRNAFSVTYYAIIWVMSLNLPLNISLTKRLYVNQHLRVTCAVCIRGLVPPGPFMKLKLLVGRPTVYSIC